MTNRSPRCTDPGASSPEDRIAQARGEAPAAAAGHIAACVACQADAVEQARLGALLGAALFRHACPPTHEIGEYALGVLAPEAAQQLATHLLDCPRCALERRTFADFFKEEAAAPAIGLLTGLRRLLAVPLQPRSPALTGLRGADSGSSTTYAAGDLRLTISVERAPRGGNRLIAGLVELDVEPARTALASLYADGRLVETEPVDDLGSFSFADVPPARYVLELALDDALVVVEDVNAQQA